MPDHARLADLLMSSSPGVAGGDRDIEIFVIVGERKTDPWKVRPSKGRTEISFSVRVSYVCTYIQT